MKKVILILLLFNSFNLLSRSQVIVKQNVLSPVELDMQRVRSVNQSLGNRIIWNYNYYWEKIENLKSDTNFDPKNYEYEGFDSNGWLVAQDIDDLVCTDTTSPTVEVIKESYEYIFKVIDSGGFKSLPNLKEGSVNFTEPKLVDEFGNELPVPKWSDQEEYYFSIEIIDKSKNATAIIQIPDKNNNETEVAIYYSPEFKSHIEGEAVNKRNIFTRVGTKTKDEYLELYNKPRHDVDPTDSPPITIKINEINSLNSDIHFKYSEGEVIKGFNKDDKLIVEEKNLDSIVIYNENFDNVELVTRVELPIYFEPDTISFYEEKFTIPYVLTNERYEKTNDISLFAEGYIPEILLNNFTFEPQKMNSGVSKQKGKLRITSSILSVGYSVDYRPRINIKSISLDTNSPDKELFSSIKIFKFDDVYTPPINWSTGLSIDIEFELNTDMALTTGTKFARLVVVSDAAPADENGELQFVENSYLYEFDGEFYKDNPTALIDGGYIQVEIVDSAQSSVTELTEDNIRILNPQPITGRELNIKINEHQGSVITLSDIEGNVINNIEVNNSQVSLDISELSSGVYFINVTDGKSQVTKKIMIVR